MEYSVASLFAGVGGVCLGFKLAKFKKLGYKLVWANEIDANANITYRYNFDHELINGDIEKIVNINRCDDEIEKEIYSEKQVQVLKVPIDILTGGFPCQAFSIAGGRRGFDDHRGNLFYSITALVMQLQNKHYAPRVLFLENVKNLTSHDNGNTYKVIKSEIERCGYLVKEALLNTKEFSQIPQNRERIYILCFRNIEDYNNFTFFNDLKTKKKLHSKDDLKLLIDMMTDTLDEKEFSKYEYTRDKYPNYFITSKKYIEDTVLSKRKIDLNLDVNQEYEYYQIRRGMYVRKNSIGVCPTLVADMGTGGHNVPLILQGDRIRKLTPSETFKLQGFPIGRGYDLPENVSNGNLYKQAGNAVTVDIIKLLAKELLKAFYKTDLVMK